MSDRMQTRVIAVEMSERDWAEHDEMMKALAYTGTQQSVAWGRWYRQARDYQNHLVEHAETGHCPYDDIDDEGLDDEKN